ncbi:AMP-binding protein [Nocardia takedensis]
MTGGLLTALYRGEAVIEFAGHRTGRDELAGAVGAVAANVAGADRVAVVAEPTVRTLIAVAGILAAGAAVVPLHPAATETERDHILRTAQVDLVLDHVDPTASAPLPPEPAADASPALVLFTSGSTGPPKGVLLSRAAIAANLDAISDLWQWHSEDVLAHSLPLFHVHGLVFGGLGPLRLGCSLVHTGHYLKPVPHASLYFGVPTLWASLRESDLRALRPARLLVSGAGALTQRCFDRVQRLSGHRLLNRYAMTETLIITSPRLSDPRVSDLVGSPVPGGEVRLVPVDGDDGPTEVQVRGPSLFSGYAHDPRAIDDEGWFATGDFGEWTDAGALRLLGRTSTDLIKTGGYRVGAGEVEGALLKHPEVAEAAVLGLPDDLLGQRIAAWVVLSERVARPELEQFLTTRLAPYKRPTEIRVVDQLPRNSLGKIQKQRLVEEA